MTDGIARTTTVDMHVQILPEFGYGKLLAQN